MHNFTGTVSEKYLITESTFYCIICYQKKKNYYILTYLHSVTDIVLKPKYQLCFQ